MWMKPITRSAGLAAVAVCLATFGCSQIVAGLCGEDDRLVLEAGMALDEDRAKLTVEQVDQLRGSIHALRFKLRKKHPACVAVAISPTQLLSVGHCKIPLLGNGTGLVAYRFHESDEPVPFKKEPFVPIALEMERRFNFEKTGYDLAIYRRKDGRFEHFIPVDPEFDFSRVQSGDRFALVANGRTNDVRHLLYLHPALNPMYDDWSFLESWCRLYEQNQGFLTGTETWQQITAKEGQDLRRRFAHEGKSVSFCADFLLYNSGAPLIRFYRAGGNEHISVVASASSTYERDKNDSVPCPDTFPNAEGSTLGPIADLVDVTAD